MTGEIIKELFPSGTPAQVLEFFFLNPGERLYLSELGTRLAFGPVRLLMGRLVEARLLVQGEEKRKAYYRANLDDPVFAELRKLFLEYRRRLGGNGDRHENRVEPSHPGQAPTEDQTLPLGSGKAGHEGPSSLTEPMPGKNAPDLEDSIPLKGTGRAMEEVKRLIARLAPTDVAVLVRGESGTGKGGIARAIHHASRASGGRFFSIDCRIFPEASLEALLFGQQRGAGGSRGPGLLGWPGGATVFLCGIEALSLPLQRKLLRTIEEGHYIPLDVLSPLPLKVRLVFGSNQALPEKVAQGSFLPELHTKLALYEMWVPPLRDRTQDIPLLARHLIERWCSRMGRQIPGLEQEAELALVDRPWPGNVRELSDVLGRTLLLLEKSSIGVSDLPAWPAPIHSAEPDNLLEARREFERRHVARILHKCSNDKVQAAKVLSVDVSTIYRIMKKASPAAGDRVREEDQNHTPEPK